MLRLQILSDIHTEMAKDEGKALVASMDSIGCDVLILAGDIISLADYERSKRTIGFFIDRGYEKIIYTPGNHDFWKSSLNAGHAIAQALEKHYSNKFFYLHTNKTVILGDQRFIGDTMWFGKNTNYYNRKGLQRGFPDFHFIDKADPELYDAHLKFRTFLEAELKDSDIVITHHLPSFKSTPARFVGEPENIFFATNMEDIILAKKPKLWIHGHTHDYFDYKIGNTRILCNPQDYPHLAPPPAKLLVINI